MGLGNSGCTGDLFLAYSWNLCLVNGVQNLDGLLAALLRGGEVCWYALLISCHSWESAAFSWLGIHHSLLNCNYIIIDLLFIFNSFAPSSSHPPRKKSLYIQPPLRSFCKHLEDKNSCCLFRICRIWHSAITPSHLNCEVPVLSRIQFSVSFFSQRWLLCSLGVTY